MVEYTSVKSIDDIKARGYRNIGIFIGGSEELNRLLKNNKNQLIILKLDDTIFYVFEKKIPNVDASQA